jgi:hypothetical protein
MPTPSTLNPFLRTLLPCIATAYGIQLLAAFPSISFQTERFYDLSGSLTYLSVTALSLYLPTIRARAAAELAGTIKPNWPSLVGALKGQGSSGGLNWRQVVLSAAVGLWAARRSYSSSFPHSIPDLSFNFYFDPVHLFPNAVAIDQER